MNECRSWVYESRRSKIGSSKEIVGECKYVYIFILKISKICNLKKVKENEKQRNKVTIEKFNPKNRHFLLRNIPEIFNRLLQRPRILSRQYCSVPFMQKKHAIRLQMKKMPYYRYLS